MDRRDLLLFLSGICIGDKAAELVAEDYYDLEELFHDRKRLLNSDIDSRIIDKINQGLVNFNLDQYKEKIWKCGAKFTTIIDESYPINLFNVENPPLVLYYKGELSVEDRYSIAIVGSRKCTSYGAWGCNKIAGELARLGIPIVSGLALGIDKIAHEAALNNKGRTIGILGNGIDIIYPQGNRYVYEQMIEKNCAIVTPFPMEYQPNKFSFPLRNRLISGIGVGTLVIEAMEKSGTLITAGYAAEQGKEIFALPGNINSLYSKGTNRLIRDGAKIVTCVEDILEELPVLKELANKSENNMDVSQLSVEELEVFQLINDYPKTVDQLINTLKGNISQIHMILTTLELKGYIMEMQGGKFTVNR